MQQRSHVEYYSDHEGVEMLTWKSAQHGFGIMDRYMESILRMTNISAALSCAKVILFNSSSDKSDDRISTSTERMMKYERSRFASELSVARVKIQGVSRCI